MITATGIYQPCGLMYVSNDWAFKNEGNALARNAFFHHFVEQIGEFGQKLVCAHALTCAFPSKVLVPMMEANAPIEKGFSTAVDYPTGKWVTKAGTENHRLFSEQTYHYTRTSTEQTCCNSTTVSSHITAHEELPQYQRIKDRLDPGVVPMCVEATNSNAGYMPSRENLLGAGPYPVTRTNGDQHTKTQTAKMRISTPHSHFKQNIVPVEASRFGSSLSGSKSHLSHDQPQIMGSKIADQNLSLSRGNSNFHNGKSKIFSPGMYKQRQGKTNYKKAPLNLNVITSVSTDVKSSQRKIFKAQRKMFKAKIEKLDTFNNNLPLGRNCRRKFIQCLNGVFCCKCGNMEKTDVEVRKEKYSLLEKCSTCKEFEWVQPTLEAAMVTPPRFYCRKEWRYNTERWAIVSAFCHSIDQMCRANNQKITTKKAETHTRFHAAVIPDISLADFSKRIAWFCGCPKECFVIALEYIHRTVEYKPEFQVNYNSAHHLILTCILLAVKFYDDAVLNHKYYAQVVGLPAAEISNLEKELLFLLRFDLFVLPGRYQQILKQMLHDNNGLYKVDLRPELN